MIVCWPITTAVRHAVRHHVVRPIRRVIINRPPVKTITKWACIVVGTGGAVGGGAMYGPIFFASPPVVASGAGSTSGGQQGITTPALPPEFLITSPNIALEQNTMSQSIEQLFPFLEQIPFSPLPETFPPPSREIIQIPEPSSQVILLIPLTAFLLLLHRRRER